MYRNLGLVALCFLATVLCICCATTITFVRKEHSYDSIIGNVADGPVPQGYVEIIKDILTKYNQNGGSNYKELKKFGLGLDQFFLFKIFEKINEDELSKQVNSTVSNVDLTRFPVPDYTDDTTGYIFKDLIVHNFPIHIKGAKTEPVYDALNSAVEYQVNVVHRADNTILEGNFYVGGSKYFFVYTFKPSNYSIDMRKKRNPATDAEKFLHIKRSVGFVSEDNVHMYDSSYENAGPINAAFKDALLLKVVPYVYSVLSEYDDQSLQRRVLEKDQEFVKLYKGLILDSLFKSAVEYVKSYVKNVHGGDDTFTAPEVVYKSASSDGSKLFEQISRNITLKGFTNYEASKLIFENTSMSSDDRHLFNMSLGIQFNYTQEGDKQAVISFVFQQGSRQYNRKFKVESITFISVYLSDLTKKPYQVYRSKDVFWNKAGILVKFEMYDADPVYSYVFSHVGNQMAKFMKEAVDASLT